MHPIYEPIDPNFYDIIICPKCGFAAVRMMFNKITSKQSELIAEKITPNFKPPVYPPVLSVDQAIERYKLALLNAMVKNAKDGEKAYICLKLIWMYKTKGDEENRLNFVKLTKSGFLNAMAKEHFPIMGLQDSTVTYLLGLLATETKEYDEALRFISNVIISKTASERLKERARDLKLAINLNKR